MMNLAEYRNRNSRLADYLPWAALIGEGAILNKDGSFQRTARFRGPDLDSAVPAELVAVAGRLNNAFRRLGSGWAIFVEAQRHPSNLYPDSRFPDAASALVDAERKADFEEAGAHYESAYYLTFTWLPPAEDAARAEGWLYEGREKNGVDPQEALNGFLDRTDRILRLIEAFKRAASRAADSIKDSFQAGSRAAESMAGGADAADAAGGAAASAAPSAPAADGPPDWAKKMKRTQQLTHGVQAAAHAVRSGDSHGGGSSINLSESDR